MTPPLPIPDRDGHLSSLALARHVYGEASPDERRAALSHLGGCTSCASVLAAMLAEDAALVIPQPPRRPARRLALRFLPLLAAAAVAVVLVAPWSARVTDEAPDHYRSRGSALALSVYVHDGAAIRLVDSGAVVRSGDRARFEIIVAEDGYLLVAGLDDAHEVYAGFPQEAGAAAVFMTRSPIPRALPTAIEFDDAPGDEHLFAMLCERPFHLDDMREAMLASLALSATAGGVDPPEGCTLRRIDLVKSTSL